LASVIFLKDESPEGVSLKPPCVAAATLTEDTSVGDENVDGAEGGDGLGDDLLALSDGADGGSGLATSWEG